MPNVSVNWHQQEVDTQEREWAFVRNQGNVIKFLYNRHQWYNYPRLSRIGAFPLHVDIEVTARCNLECPMCPRRHADISDYDHMEIDLFHKIVDECADHNLFSARLSWRGESLSHPNFLDLVHYIKCEKKIPNVSFLTNGHYLTEKIARGLVEKGLDYISFSVDGIDAIYDKIRAPAKFGSVFNNIKRLKEIRDRAKVKNPQIRVSGLWPAIAQNKSAYFEKMSKLADKIVSNPVKDYGVDEKTEFISEFICPQPWERLFIGFDGKVQPCPNSVERLYIGNCKKTSLAEIWNGEELSKLRADHIVGNIDNYFACSRCSFRVNTDYKAQLKKDWSDWSPTEYLPKVKK